jgi:hypothetical protein
MEEVKIFFQGFLIGCIFGAIVIILDLFSFKNDGKDKKDY